MNNLKTLTVNDAAVLSQNKLVGGKKVVKDIITVATPYERRTKRKKRSRKSRVSKNT
jgi:hypothetical protein